MQFSQVHLGTEHGAQPGFAHSIQGVQMLRVGADNGKLTMPAVVGVPRAMTQSRPEPLPVKVPRFIIQVGMVAVCPQHGNIPGAVVYIFRAVPHLGPGAAFPKVDVVVRISSLTG